MWKEKKFHIECDVALSGIYLIGTNEKGETQTVEDVLNSLGASVRFENVVVKEN